MSRPIREYQLRAYDHETLDQVKARIDPDPAITAANLDLLAHLHGEAFGPRFEPNWPTKIYLGSLGIDWSRRENCDALIALMQTGAIKLSRADYVTAMDPAMVARSEVKAIGGIGEWHFLVIDP